MQSENQVKSFWYPFRFQSLIGILMNCNAREYGLINDNQAQVSIPNRDFNELQFYPSASIIADSLVSIPNRDFNELQLSKH